MPVWVTDSRFPGYLGPAQPYPPDDDELVDILHDVIAGVTGLSPALVRPSWQPESPNIPDINVNWCGFGTSGESFDWMPAIEHIGDGDGHDELHRNIESVIHVTFYGPNAARYAALLRDGLFIEQNAANLRAMSMAVVEVQEFILTPELFRDDRWYNRADLDFTIRREVVRRYEVLNILKAEGTVMANPPGADHTVDVDWDTDNHR